MRALPLPYCDMCCAPVGTSSSLSMAHAAYTHARSPETHLECHDRLADHREQP
jgi:hypothetical protein